MAILNDQVFVFHGFFVFHGVFSMTFLHTCILLFIIIIILTIFRDAPFDFWGGGGG